MSGRSSPLERVGELFANLRSRIGTTGGRIDGVRGRVGRTLRTGEGGLDLADDGDAFVVTVDVPGYTASDIEVRLTDETLEVSGERELTTETDGAEYHRRERRRQSMSRRIELPEPVEGEDIGATVKNGVLTVTLPKRDSSGPSRIPVE